MNHSDRGVPERRSAGSQQRNLQAGSYLTPFVHLVDGDAGFVSALARHLVVHGFAVQTHATAADFLERRDAKGAGCVVADLPLPGDKGPDLQAALADSPNPLPLLFVAGCCDIRSTVRAMRAGAEDVLAKGEPPEQFVEAVRRALARDARERCERERQEEMRARFDAVSVRELEVLSHVVQGRLNKQIAGDLGIRERTVKLHRTAIMTKLGVRSVAALTRLTQEASLFTA